MKKKVSRGKSPRREAAVLELGLIRWGRDDLMLVWRDEDFVDRLDAAALAHVVSNEIAVANRDVDLYYVDAEWFGYRAARVEPALAALLENDPREGLRYIHSRTGEEAATLIGPHEVGYFSAAERAQRLAESVEIENVFRKAGARSVNFLQESLARTIARAFYARAPQQETAAATKNVAFFVIGKAGLTAIMCDEAGVINEYTEAAPADIPTSLWLKAAFEEAREGLSSSILERFFVDGGAVEKRVYLWGEAESLKDAIGDSDAEVGLYADSQTRHAAGVGLWALLRGEAHHVRRAAFERDVQQQLHALEERLRKEAAAEQASRRRRLALALARPLWIGASIAVILATDAQLRSHAVERDLQQWQQRKTELQAQIATMQQNVRRLEETGALIAEIAALGKRQQEALAPLADLSARLKEVDGLRISRFAISPQGEITIEGAAPRTSTIAASAQAIEGDPRYKTPTIITKESPQEDLLQFEAHTVRNSPASK